MTDMIYFGNHYDENTDTSLKDFLTEITEVFPHAIIRDAYDSVKGVRREITLPDFDNNNYYAFLIGKQWTNLSFNLSLLRLENHPGLFQAFFNLAKIQYPNEFKAKLSFFKRIKTFLFLKLWA